MLKMTMEKFDSLLSSKDAFNNLTGNFLGAFDFILENWAVGNTCKLYDFNWDNVIIMSMAHQQEAIETADYDDYEDDVDETNYDPYMGCDFYESYDYDLTEWQFL